MKFYISPTSRTISKPKRASSNRFVASMSLDEALVFRTGVALAEEYRRVLLYLPISGPCLTFDSTLCSEILRCMRHRGDALGKKIPTRRSDSISGSGSEE